MSAKRIHIDIILWHNNQSKRGSLLGSAYLEAGFLMGRFHPLGEDRFTSSEQQLLSAFTFTGCPIAARTLAENANPWLWTNGAYVGNRKLVADYLMVLSEINAWQKGQDLEASLSLKIFGELPEIKGIAAPFQEKIEPVKPGHLWGMFNFHFATEGGTIRAFAETEYRLKTDRPARRVFRNITIATPEENGQMCQIEQIDLFDDLKQADADLSQRLRVH